MFRNSFFKKILFEDGDIIVVKNADEIRDERLFRRKVIADWKKAAKAIKDKNHKMLLKEARREATTIVEDAARTAIDFKKVNYIWDEIEIIESWRIEKQEVRRTDELRDYQLPERETIIPPPLGHEWWRNLLGGNFLDNIYDCPHEI